jgi:hypothetical protein
VLAACLQTVAHVEVQMRHGPWRSHGLTARNPQHWRMVRVHHVQPATDADTPDANSESADQRGGGALPAWPPSRRHGVEPPLARHALEGMDAALSKPQT